MTAPTPDDALALVTAARIVLESATPTHGPVDNWRRTAEHVNVAHRLLVVAEQQMEQPDAPVVWR